MRECRSFSKMLGPWNDVQGKNWLCFAGLRIVGGKIPFDVARDKLFDLLRPLGVNSLRTTPS